MYEYINNRTCYTTLHYSHVFNSLLKSWRYEIREDVKYLPNIVYLMYKTNILVCSESCCWSVPSPGKLEDWRQEWSRKLNYRGLCFGVINQCNKLWQTYEGRSKSSRPDLVLFRIKLKYYLILIVARHRTRHAQYDFWAINILCILAYEHSFCQMGVENANTKLCTGSWRTSQTIKTWPSKN